MERKAKLLQNLAVKFQGSDSIDDNLTSSRPLFPLSSSHSASEASNPYRRSVLEDRTDFPAISQTLTMLHLRGLLFRPLRLGYAQALSRAGE
jgi:hypothetical protein